MLRIRLLGGFEASSDDSPMPGLGPQLRHFLGFEPALGAADPVILNHHRGLVLPPRQVSHLALPHFFDLGGFPAASRADQQPVASLPPHPQPQPSRPLVDLMPVNPIPRPVQNLCKLALSQSRRV